MTAVRESSGLDADWPINRLSRRHAKRAKVTTSVRSLQFRAAHTRRNEAIRRLSEPRGIDGQWEGTRWWSTQGALQRACCRAPRRGAVICERSRLIESLAATRLFRHGSGYLAAATRVRHHVSVGVPCQKKPCKIERRPAVEPAASERSAKVGGTQWSSIPGCRERVPPASRSRITVRGEQQRAPALCSQWIAPAPERKEALMMVLCGPARFGAASRKTSEAAGYSRYRSRKKCGAGRAPPSQSGVARS